MGLGSIVTLLVIALVVVNNRRRNATIATVRTPAKAEPETVIVRDPLAKAKHMLNAASSKIFVKEVESVVWNEVGEKLRIQPVALNQSSVISELKERGADEVTIQSFRQLMYDCESALYIPGQTNEDLQGILDRAEGFLREVGRLTS